MITIRIKIITQVLIQRKLPDQLFSCKAINRGLRNDDRNKDLP